MERAAAQTPWADFKKWWIKNEGKAALEANVDMYSHHPLFSPAINISNSVIAVIDIKTMMYIYTSPNFPEFTGWSKEDIANGGVQFAFSRILPSDQAGVVAFSELINTYFKELPESQKAYYRAYWDFSLRNNKDKFFRVLQQDCAIKHDTHGNIEELLLFVSKIENIITDTSQHLRLTNGIENLFYKYDHATKAVAQLQLPTEREMEIVKLIAKSATLKQIAEKLNISFNTVKAHSTNIMQKLQVKDSLEMVNLLRVWGFI